MRVKKILFLFRSNSKTDNAYTHRLNMLRNALERQGFETGAYYMGDRKLTSHVMLPFYLRTLAGVIRDYDIVHAGGTPCAFAASLSKFLHGKKVIYDVHGDCIGEAVQSPWKGKFLFENAVSLGKAFVQELGAVTLADYYLVVSRPLSNLFRRRGIDESRIFLIRNGVDDILFHPGEGSDEETLTVTYAGQYQSYQAIDDLIDAAEACSSRNMIFQFIGFTDDDAARKRTIQERLGARCVCGDRMSQYDLVNALQGADVLVIPRRPGRVTCIAFPTKFAEYIALGKPVIVSDVDETADFVRTHRCGLVYTARSGQGADSLARTLDRFSGLALPVRIRMGENGRKLAESVFNWQRIGGEYACMLHQL